MGEGTALDEGEPVDKTPPKALGSLVRAEASDTTVKVGSFSRGGCSNGLGGAGKRIGDRARDRTDELLDLPGKFPEGALTLGAFWKSRYAIGR